MLLMFVLYIKGMVGIKNKPCPDTANLTIIDQLKG